MSYIIKRVGAGRLVAMRFIIKTIYSDTLCTQVNIYPISIFHNIYNSGFVGCSEYDHPGYVSSRVRIIPGTYHLRYVSSQVRVNPGTYHIGYEESSVRIAWVRAISKPAPVGPSPVQWCRYLLLVQCTVFSISDV